MLLADSTDQVCVQHHYENLTWFLSLNWSIEAFNFTESYSILFNLETRYQRWRFKLWISRLLFLIFAFAIFKSCDILFDFLRRSLYEFRSKSSNSLKDGQRDRFISHRCTDTDGLIAESPSISSPAEHDKATLFIWESFEFMKWRRCLNRYDESIYFVHDSLVQL